MIVDSTSALLGNRSVVAAVPMRGGSKSIPGKNIKPFSGKPLCEWALSALLGCSWISRIFVSTDSDEIAAVVSSISARIHIHRRPAHLATDCATTEDAIRDLINACDIREEFIVTAQATSPQTTSKDVEEAISHLIRTGADSLVTCVRLRRFFWRDDGTPINYDPAKRPMRQQWTGTLVENGAFYISSVEHLKRGGARLHGKIAIYEMDQGAEIELDELSDWEKLEAVFRRKTSP